MKILALDLSLTSTGYCRDRVGVESRILGRIRTTKKGPARLAFIRGQVLGLTTEIELVVIEGYGYAGSPKGHVLGELGGVVRVALFEKRGVDYVVIAPTALKKYATGKGNAGKEVVLAEAIRRLGYTGSSHDEADALWLWAMAKDHYDEPVVKMPAVNREALEKVEWPEIMGVTV